MMNDNNKQLTSLGYKKLKYKIIIDNTILGPAKCNNIKLIINVDEMMKYKEDEKKAIIYHEFSHMKFQEIKKKYKIQSVDDNQEDYLCDWFTFNIGNKIKIADMRKLEYKNNGENYYNLIVNSEININKYDKWYMIYSATK